MCYDNVKESYDTTIAEFCNNNSVALALESYYQTPGSCVKHQQTG